MNFSWNVTFAKPASQENLYTYENQLFIILFTKAHNWSPAWVNTTHKLFLVAIRIYCLSRININTKVGRPLSKSGPINV